MNQTTKESPRTANPLTALFRRPRNRIVAGAAALVVVALIAAVVFFFTGGTPANHGPIAVTTLVPTSTGTIFTIDQTGSQASFTIGEILLGNPNVVVGKTNQVAGQILVDQQHPSQSQVGQIKVDLSTLATDNPLRNHSLQSFILQTDQPGNQYGVFNPTSLSGMPATVTIGQAVNFSIKGDLTIHGVTKPETFTAQVTLTSATALTGTATTTVKYQDFNITIPNVPSVAGVTDNVTLTLSLAAHV